jgi:hypothetical protein
MRVNPKLFDRIGNALWAVFFLAAMTGSVLGVVAFFTKRGDLSRLERAEKEAERANQDLDNLLKKLNTSRMATKWEAAHINENSQDKNLIPPEVFDDKK